MFKEFLTAPTFFLKKKQKKQTWRILMFYGILWPFGEEFLYENSASDSNELINNRPHVSLLEICCK